MVSLEGVLKTIRGKQCWKIWQTKQFFIQQYKP